MDKIFISYNRSDTAPDANALYTSLCQLYGPDRVYRDVNDVRLGENWQDEVHRQVRAAAVLLLLIGPRWQATAPIMLELSTGLQNGIPVIPILVGRNDLRTVSGLPDSVYNLNAPFLDYPRWGAGILALSAAIDVRFGGQQTPPTASTPNKVSILLVTREDEAVTFEVSYATHIKLVEVRFSFVVRLASTTDVYMDGAAIGRDKHAEYGLKSATCRFPFAIGELRTSEMAVHVRQRLFGAGIAGARVHYRNESYQLV